VPRKQLIENIRKMDGKLSLEQSLLKLNGRERVAYLRGLSPWLLIGAGAAGGILLGILGSGGRSMIVSAGMTGLHVWRLKMLASSLTGGGADAADATGMGGDVA
jgi:hypothetical protein